VSSEQRGERGFIVVDKRGGDGEAAPAAKPPEPAGRELPRPDFAALAISLGHSALFHLGLVADPATGKQGTRDLALARQSIDILEMLEGKTKGNLTADEARLLEDLLYDLRMRFVEASK
jgi:hypothetical protein